MAQDDHPEVAVDMRPGRPPEVHLSVRRLLADGRFLGALESGFPLYVEYRVELRESRPLWDRTVDEYGWEYVVLFDPVREIFVVEDPQGSEEYASRDALRGRLANVYVVDFLGPDGTGEFYYKGIVHARTLSEEDVDEVFAWLKGETYDSTNVGRPGLFTRVARRLLREVAPLPRITMEGRTRNFRR